MKKVDRREKVDKATISKEEMKRMKNGNAVGPNDVPVEVRRCLLLFSTSTYSAQLHFTLLQSISIRIECHLMSLGSL